MGGTLGRKVVEGDLRGGSGHSEGTGEPHGGQRAEEVAPWPQPLLVTASHS